MFLFLFVFFYVTLSNYEVCDNGNAMKQCKFQNNDGTIAQRKVSSCAPIFKFFYGASGFFLRGKFIPKIAIFCDFGGRKATFLSKLSPQRSAVEMFLASAYMFLGY